MISLGRKGDASLGFLNRLVPAVVITTAVIFGCIALLVLSVVMKQFGKDRAFEDQLKPSIRFVEEFQRKNRWLPTNSEFEARPKTEPDLMVQYYGVELAPKYQKEGARVGVDFYMSIWRGESATCYFSWTKSYGIVSPGEGIL